MHSEIKKYQTIKPKTIVVENTTDKEQLLTNKKWFKFGLWGGIYILFIIWVWNFWLILGIPIMYMFQKDTIVSDYSNY